ncbi:MAG: hypothetical protein JSV89_07530 [Spirochaetaceae bacterium]|nr:MAG: hypothetical protein JSV89_07530 [Spirochaetaceae bacterium]
MDLLEKMSSFGRKWFARIFPLVLVLTGSFPVHGYAPTVLLGLYGLEQIAQDQGGQPAVRASGLVSWRTLMAENASLALYARSLVDRSLLESGQFYDSHTLSIDTLIRGEAGRIFLEGGLNGSWIGTFEGQAPYFRPDWRVGYERDRDHVLTSFAYSGYYLSQPGDSEDALFQGLTLGLAVDPSIRLRYGLEILGGWELWTEESRNDLLGSVNASVGGLIGYFVDWRIAAQGGLRWSEASEESNLYLSLDSDWAWSPHRQVSLELGIFTREEIYLWTGTIPAVPTIFSAGVNFRGDWTPNDRLYLVTELSASRKFADDPADSWWSMLAQAGIEFRF